MHICFICHEYPPCKHGGIGSFTKDLAESLVTNYNFKITVVGFYLQHDLEIKEPIDEYINGVRTIRYQRTKTFKIEQFNTFVDRYKLYALIKKIHKEAHIHLVEAPGGSGWLPFGTPNSIPLITRLHGGEVYTASQMNKKVSKIIYYFEKYQILNSNKIIAVSKFIGKELNDLLNISFKFDVIYNSVDNVFLQEYSSEVEKGLIVFAGTIRESKGVKSLIKACNIIFERNSYSKLILAGRMTYIDNEPYEDIIRKELNPKFQTRVKFLGPLSREDELIPLYNKADLCCFPSYFEAFSLVPMEAMALGKCVLFTKLTSGKELITDKVNGYLIDPYNSNEIATRIINIMENDNEKKNIEIKAHNHIKYKFAFEKWILNNVNLYRKLNNEN